MAGRNVFANGREISAKASSNRSIAALPDVCLSPPGPPTGPVPIAYPNSAFSGHTSFGTRTVKMDRREIGKKNISKYARSTGNEPATRTFGMGMISHNITGPMKFASWSMDVKVEGANVTRHLDLTTHNHSNGGQAKGICGGTEADNQTSNDTETCQEFAESNDDARETMRTQLVDTQESLSAFRRKPQTKKGIEETKEQATARAEKKEDEERKLVAGCAIVRARHKPPIGEPKYYSSCSNKLDRMFDNTFCDGLGFVDGLSTRESLEYYELYQLPDDSPIEDHDLERKRRKDWINAEQGESAASKKKNNTTPHLVTYHNSLACFGTSDCDNIPFKYKSAARLTPAYASHAEARIIDEIYRAISGQGGSLLLCIDWPGGATKNGLSKRSPCNPSCKDLICAVHKCCMNIMICNENNEAEEPTFCVDPKKPSSV